MLLMNTHTLSPLTHKPASHTGTLDRFETRCTCGLVIASSLETLAQQDAHQHMEWHKRQEAKRD